MSDLQTQSQLNQIASKIDPLIAPCPKCGGQLRMEFKVEWRPLAEAAVLHNVTAADVIASGAQVDAFGRVKAGVPYVTCMSCGMHTDATPREETDQ